MTEEPRKLVKLSTTRSDTNKAVDGDWVDSSQYDGVRYLLRSSTYKPYTVAKSEADRRFRKGLSPKDRDTRNMDFADQCKYYGPIVAEHLILGWDGFADDEDKPIPFSKEKVREILSDAGHWVMLTDIMGRSWEVGQAAVEYVDETVKNSKRPSVTP